jgi:hypothetical protein
MRIEYIFKLRHRYLKECRALQRKLIQEGQRKGEIAKPSENQANLVTNGNRVVKTLPELGISRKEPDEYSIESVFG